MGNRKIIRIEKAVEVIFKTGINNGLYFNAKHAQPCFYSLALTWPNFVNVFIFVERNF